MIIGEGLMLDKDLQPIFDYLELGGEGLGSLFELIYKVMEERDPAALDDKARFIEAAWWPFKHCSIYVPADKSCGKAKTNVLLFSHELSRTGAPSVVRDMAVILRKNGYRVIVATPRDGNLVDELMEEKIPAVVDLLTYTELKTITYFLKKEAEFTLANSAVLFPLIHQYIKNNEKIHWWLHEGTVSLQILEGHLPKSLPDNISPIYGGKYVPRKFEDFGYDYHGEVFLYGINDFWDGNYADLSALEKMTFFCIGQYNGRKNQGLLLDALSYMTVDELEQFEVIFVGSRTTDPVLTDEVEAAGEAYKNVKCYSEIPLRELYDMYKKGGCIICTSVDDPMPLVLTENMCIGNIVICTNETGTADFMESGKNGYVFPSGDAKALADIIRQVIHNKENLRPMQIESRKCYEDNFAMKDFEKRTIELVENHKA